MIRIVTVALLLAGLGTPACPASGASQPETQFNTAPEIYSYSSTGQSYLGVDIQDVTAQRMGPLKLKEERGVEVTMVDQDAPAGKAGVKERDVILEFNGTPVESEDQLRRLIREIPPGRTVRLGLSRDGNPMNISVKLADRRKIVTERAPRVIVPRMPEIPRVEIPGYAIQWQTYSSSLGIQTENLSRQLGEFFGVKDAEGVLVRSVEKGSPAEKAGIKAGDVIVRADNEKLSDRADLSHVLRNHREGGKLPLGVVRDKREQTIVVDLPQRGSDDSFWRYFPSDEFQSNWSDFQEQLREMVRDEVKPQIAYAREMTAAQVLSALEKARLQLRDAQPEVEKAIRQAEIEARRARKLLEQQLREKIHSMI
jgi:serine protease Do